MDGYKHPFWPYGAMGRNFYFSKFTPVRALIFEDPNQRERLAPYSACHRFEFSSVSFNCVQMTRRKMLWYVYKLVTDVTLNT